MTHVLLAALVAFAGCGGPTPSTLPAATVLTYTTPSGWEPWTPPGTSGAEPLFLVSGRRAGSDGQHGATLQLQTMETPANFAAPQTPEELQTFAAALQGASAVRRWIELTSTTIDGFPAIRSAALTAGGTQYRWIVFSRDKLFLLTLAWPNGLAQSPDAVRGALEASLALK